MKISGKKLSTLLIAIILPLAYLTYWFLRMSAVSPGAEIILSGGVIASIGLGIVALKKGEAPRWVAISFIIGAILCALIFLGINLWAGWSETRPGLVSYHVSINGLEGRTGGLITTILVPIPMQDGEMVIPSSRLVDQTFDNWTTTMVKTKDGRMLAFQNRHNNLTDIQGDFYIANDDINSTKRIPEEYLSPVLENITDEEYTTVIYVDEGIRPPGNLTVNLRLSAGGGLYHGMFEQMYRTEIQETVPAGTTGRIVVTAEVGEYRPPGP
ncbi:hypothetical protein E2N92_00220 [Methanofollis formosanus]|uniref:Uncharacterized protein n=1 Tax=Methanofollis formosanus TaxID=299308 RepID=A0A8G0ZY32_9EURY|nr:hypothetical protein [Methanofollis formosanus]QYZ77960.1 hypothetical protein E2N92_00220 [Methanofollis formosanus]